MITHPGVREEQPTLSISEKAKTIVALENERNNLWQESKTISAKQSLVMANAAREMLKLSMEQSEILSKMDALDRFIQDILK